MDRLETQAQFRIVLFATSSGLITCRHFAGQARGKRPRTCHLGQKKCGFITTHQFSYR